MFVHRLSKRPLRVDHVQKRYLTKVVGVQGGCLPCSAIDVRAANPDAVKSCVSHDRHLDERARAHEPKQRLIFHSYANMVICIVRTVLDYISAQLLIAVHMCVTVNCTSLHRAHTHTLADCSVRPFPLPGLRCAAIYLHVVRSSGRSSIRLSILWSPFFRRLVNTNTTPCALRTARNLELTCQHTAAHTHTHAQVIAKFHKNNLTK